MAYSLIEASNNIGEINSVVVLQLIENWHVSNLGIPHSNQMGLSLSRGYSGTQWFEC